MVLVAPLGPTDVKVWPEPDPLPAPGVVRTVTYTVVAGGQTRGQPGATVVAGPAPGKVDVIVRPVAATAGAGDSPPTTVVEPGELLPGAPPAGVGVGLMTSTLVLVVINLEVVYETVRYVV